MIDRNYMVDKISGSYKILALFFVLALNCSAYSQCPPGTFALAVTPPNPGTSTVNGLTAGDYITVDVIAGNVYTFTTCGGAGYDTQLTLFDNTTTQIGYNDDDGTCAFGLESTITWTATYTGTVDLQLSEFGNGCAGNASLTTVLVTSALPIQTGNGCNTNISICTPGIAGPFGFSTPGNPVGSCLNWIGLSYAYVALYVTQSGPLEIEINGDATGGYLDVAVFNIPQGADPCTAINDVNNEISCNYATNSSGCNQIGTAFPCPSSVPSPNVTAGDVLFIVVENWSNASTNFTLDLAPAPAAQTGPPDATINAVSLCDTDGATQITAANAGGIWSGANITANGIFDATAAGAGVHSVNYDVGALPCLGSSTANITVTACASCAITNGNMALDDCYVNAGFLEYDIVGNVTFTDPPTTGDLIIQDCYGVTMTAASAPFTSPVAFAQTGLPQTGAACNHTAYFSADPACNYTINFNAPPPITGFNISCTIGGGGMNGDISFDDTYSSGSLIVSVDDGTTVVQDVITLPTTSPQNWAVTGLDPAVSPYTVDYYFSDYPSCGSQMVMNCGCSADAGTSNVNVTGNGGSVGGTYILCDGDQIDITTNNDYTYNDDLGPLGGFSYQPELAYLVYDCLPTPGLFPGSDPCFVTLIASPQDLVDLNSGASLDDFFGTGAVNQTMFIAPITLYHYDAVLGNYIMNSNCWDIGDVTEVSYLNPIVDVQTPDCQDSSVSINLTGGYPEYFGGNYIASNLTPSNAAFVNSTTTSGGDIIINGLLNGDMWSFDVVDDNNCPVTIAGGPFVGLPDANAGIDDTTCTLTYTLSAIASVGSGMWTGPASITFGNANSASSSVSAASAGTYSLIWTENNGGGCTDLDVVDITFSNLSYTSVIAHSTCGGSNGSITFTAAGGVAPYTYSIDNNTTTQASSSFTGIAANTYASIVTDALGCEVTSNETINNAGAPTINNIVTVDPLCSSSCDGTITLSVSGGTSPYNYSINGGALQASNTFTGLCDNTFALLVEDDNTCQVASATTLTEPSAITVTVSSLDPLCNGGGGSINIFASGGTVGTNYSYIVDDNTNPTVTQSNGAFTGLPGGNFDITVTDDNFCMSTITSTITEPAAIGSVVNSTSNVSCAGECDGIADVSGTGGTIASDYQYLWSDFSAQTTNIASGLCGGTPSIIYTVTITDDNFCETTRQVQIAEPVALSISSSTTSSSCGQSNGIVCVTVIGGASGYNYFWSTGDITQCVSGIPSGAYSVTVQDQSLCSINTNAIITDLNGHTAAISSTDVICFGGTEGSGTAVASGGSGTFSYDWTNSAGTTVSNGSNAVNLSGGTYFIDVTDDNTGCVISSAITVSEPPELQYSSSELNPTCFAYNDGEISVSVIGGVTPYGYLWNTSPTQTSAIASNLMAGFYNVDILDANSCGTSLLFTLTEPTQVTATENTIDVDCFGNANGSITLIASGGTGAYNYAWANNPFTSPTVINLGAGNHPYTVTDVVGNCSYNGSVNINEPSELVVMVNSSGDVTCFGGTDGFITSNTFGGAQPYVDYQWSFGLGSSANLTGIPANTYCVLVTDNNGCQATTCQTVTQPTELILTIPAVTNVSCNGACDGSALAVASGSTAPYFYQWNIGGNLSNQNLTNNLCATPAATITVIDNNGCSSSASTPITEPSAITFTSQIVQSHCGLNDGSIYSHSSGGVLPYSYEWNPSLGTSSSLTGIPGGIYVTTVTDGNGCTEQVVSTVNDILGASIGFLNSVNPSCFGYSDGSINTNVSGGTTPYQYIGWINSNFDTVAIGAVGIALLPADSYSEIIVDFAGCFTGFPYTLVEPSPVITAIVAQTNVSCFGGNDGTASVLAGGGTLTGFTYSWTPSNQTSTTATGFNAGPLAVVASDANGCIATTTATITQPSAISITHSVSDVSCFGGSDGCISCVVSGGANGFYLYDWDCTNNSSNNVCNLPAGTCFVTVTDQHGCSETSVAASILEPTELTATVSSSDAVCTGYNGSVTISGSGGTLPYTSSYPGGATSFTLTGLYYGTYTAEITDDHGCSVSLPVSVVDQPGPIINSITFIEPSCFGECDGQATVAVSSGTTPFNYEWCDVAAQGTPSASGLCSGNYCITVTDNNGCTAIDYDVLSEPSELIVTALPPTIQVCAGECATIGAVPSGSNPGYSISWSDPSLSGFNPMPVCNGPSTLTTYSYTVTDALGCKGSNQTLVTVGPELIVTMPGTVETCLGNPVAICADGFGGTAISDYAWTWSNNYSSNSASTSCQQVNPTDTTVFQATLNDGCSTPASGFITVIVNPIPTLSYGVLENEGCPPFEAYFNGSSSMDNSSIEWDFNGDGIIDTTDLNINTGDFSYPVYTYQNSGLYTVSLTVISEDNCSSTVSIQDYIDVYPQPIASFITDPIVTELINPTVEVNGSFSIGVDSLYMWDFDDVVDSRNDTGMHATHVYSDTGHYYISLDVVNTAGCHDFDTVLFAVNPDYAIYAPNAFSPNDDNVNDGFRIYGVGLDLNNFELMIYNRWGEVIFKSDKLDQEWDGIIKGTENFAPNDVYIWKALVTPYEYTEPIHLIGHVTVVR